MSIDTAHFRNKLQSELSILEEELKTAGRRNPDNQSDWEGKPAEYDTPPGDDPIDQADVIEEFENNSAVVKQLEIRYNEVESALRRIEDGTYGVCSVSGEPIEESRLEANPAATTCLEHKNN